MCVGKAEVLALRIATDAQFGEDIAVEQSRL